MSETPIIRAEKLNKWFASAHILRDVSLEVAPRERMVICGPSGSGKSTFIRCLNGLETPDSGHIEINNIVFDSPRAAEKIRRTVGMVFQQFNLFPHLTIIENCMLAPHYVRKLKRSAARQIAMEHLERLRIGEHAEKYPSQLSGGQQQRVAIARALCMEPKIMLFDEPTSALDPEMIREVLDAMVDLAKAGVTMLCVTHEMGFARHFADQIIFMDGGEIVEQAPPERFFTAPATDRARLFLDQILHRD